MRRLPPVHTAKRLQTGRGRHQPKWLVQDVGEEGGLERFPITGGAGMLQYLCHLPYSSLRVNNRLRSLHHDERMTVQ